MLSIQFVQELQRSTNISDLIHGSTAICPSVNADGVYLLRKTTKNLQDVITLTSGIVPKTEAAFPAGVLLLQKVSTSWRINTVVPIMELTRL